MTIYQALRILAPEMKLYFTDFKIGDRFDNERAQASNRSSQVYDPFSDDHGKIFSDGLHYKNIILLKEDGSVFVKEEFTPTQKEREECAKYYVCDFYLLDDDYEFPFVRRHKAKGLLVRIADKMDEYIVKNKLVLSDPDEDEDGQCVSSFMLADALEGDEGLAAKAAKLSKRKMLSLAAMFMERTIWIDEEADIAYGEVFMIDLEKTGEGIRVDIWDGWPK